MTQPESESLFEAVSLRALAEPECIRDLDPSVFRDHAHESGPAFLERLQVDQACSLLRQGQAATIPDGFSARTGLTPDQYRKLGPEFTLRVPAGYRFRTVLDFYGRDTENISEQVFSDGLLKCFESAAGPAVLELRFRGEHVDCTTDAPDPYHAHQIAARILGLNSDAAGMENTFAADPLLGAAIRRQRGLRIPLTPTPWEALSWAILGQQINLRFAVTLRRELIALAGGLHSSGLRAHPGAASVAALNPAVLLERKFSRSKASYLLGAAEAVASGALNLDEMRNRSALRAARLLVGVRGIGPWTVQYTLLRGLGFADCLPAGDAGLAQGLERLTGERPSESAIRQMLAKYSPWRSLATYHVWASLHPGDMA